MVGSGSRRRRRSPPGSVESGPSSSDTASHFSNKDYSLTEGRQAHRLRRQGRGRLPDRDRQRHRGQGYTRLLRQVQRDGEEDHRQGWRRSQVQGSSPNHPQGAGSSDTLTRLVIHFHAFF